MIERTSGMPLFVEELTRSVLESGAAHSGREISVTLHDSLVARLDRLGPAKEVAQIGAVIGSEFFYELLHAVERRLFRGRTGSGTRQRICRTYLAACTLRREPDLCITD